MTATPPPAPAPRTDAPLTKGLRLGSIGGAPLILTSGLGLIAVIYTAIAVTNLTRAGLDAPRAVGIGLAMALALTVSVLLHELAHGAAARAFGYEVREYVLTLWGGHTAFTREVATPLASAVVAAVGPLTNAVIAGLCWLASANTHGLAGYLLGFAALTNALLAGFNFVPALPLDGGRVLEAIVWRATGNRERGAYISGRVGQVFAVAIPLYALGRPLLAGQQPSITTALWSVLIAGLIWQGASQTVKVAQARRSAAAVDLRGHAQPVLLVPATATLAQLPDGVPAVVLDGGRPVGLLDGAAAAAVPGERRAALPVTAVMRTGRVAVLTEVTGAPAVAHMAQALQTGASAVLVPLGEGYGLVDVDGVARSLGMSAAR